MGWTQIITALLTVLAPKLPAWVLAFVKSWLGMLTPPTLSQNLFGDAPDALKDMIKKFLLLNVQSIRMPFLKLIMTKVVESLTDAVLDQVWNLLFPSKAVPIAVQASEEIDFDALVAEFA
jgi:hypothetical protein